MGSRKRHKLIIAFLFAIAFVYGAPNFVHCRSQDKTPNVIIITLDALRPDHLGCYGYPRNTSPNIDRLAKGGVVFNMAISQATWTGGSLASLLTSTYPSTHRIEDWGVVLDRRLITIAEVLKEKKYVTACASGGDWIYKDVLGLGEGFDHFFAASDERETFQQAAEWIQKNKNHNFFIWMHLFNYPHAPYNAPAPFNQMFMSNRAPRNLPISKEKEQFLSVGVIPSWVAVDNITDANYYISQYDGEIAFADSLIGGLLDTLKKEEVDKNTIIIISSDHGESLGERGVYFQHGDCVYNEQIRVPLIINGPIVPQGLVIKYPVQLIDIMPSLADMLGIKLDAVIEGKSFFPFTSNRAVNFAFSEVNATKVVGGSRENAQAQAIISVDWKLIYEKLDLGRKFSYELYNLETDPQELHNLAQTEREKFEFMKQKLETWINRSKLKVERKIKPLDEEAQKKLKSLGYLQ